MFLGTYSNSGADVCTNCPPGNYCPLYSESPLQCAGGYWSPGMVRKSCIVLFWEGFVIKGVSTQGGYHMIRTTEINGFTTMAMESLRDKCEYHWLCAFVGGIPSWYDDRFESSSEYGYSQRRCDMPPSSNMLTWAKQCVYNQSAVRANWGQRGKMEFIPNGKYSSTRDKLKAPRYSSEPATWLRRGLSFLRLPGNRG